MDSPDCYYDYDDAVVVACPGCGWQGKGEEGEKQITPGGAGFILLCPDCNRPLASVPFPTPAETRERAAAGDPRAAAGLPYAELAEARWRLFDEHKLSSPDQLPMLEGDELALVWDMERRRDDYWTVIRIGEREIWSEPALWEGWDRAIEVKEILRERYGQGFVSLTPTAGSELYLRGDRIVLGEFPAG